MSTRNLTMVVDRRHAEDNSFGFAANPDAFEGRSYVNMYLHHDGYPEWQGVQLANWITHMQKDEGFTNFGDGSRIASHLVKDFHYNAQYLYPSHNSIDHQYTYIIWVGKPDVWISCYDQYNGGCVFVADCDKVRAKYINKADPMDYVDWKLYKQTTNKER
tara:strand:+ start:1926 stop:2405 length:480 start_codon:yes stop_codon:yes gene_type:complete